ncbi:hypothetical protein CONLIGDRAFT_679821 [Coniochaeta ligniaria NRRL 30616]|uniref:Uncharacterized protein n=1 Tax=Coniochaeta ligniaria NRRL 30616 TaxID=1408157 RepID=A0A1J7IUT5_9PEZI|nr:hypothetical protein CONLIGDRAFT_679821 [Coniochaeta ligniaria NRRL 30616]
MSKDHSKTHSSSKHSREGTPNAPSKRSRNDGGISSSMSRMTIAAVVDPTPNAYEQPGAHPQQYGSFPQGQNPGYQTDQNSAYPEQYVGGPGRFGYSEQSYGGQQPSYSDQRLDLPADNLGLFSGLPGQANASSSGGYQGVSYGEDEGEDEDTVPCAPVSRLFRAIAPAPPGYVRSQDAPQAYGEAAGPSIPQQTAGSSAIQSDAEPAVWTPEHILTEEGKFQCELCGDVSEQIPELRHVHLRPIEDLAANFILS